LPGAGDGGNQRSIGGMDTIKNPLDGFERQTLLLQFFDAVEPREVRGRIERLAPASLRRREESAVLVIANGIDADSAAPGEFVHAERLGAGSSVGGGSAGGRGSVIHIGSSSISSPASRSMARRALRSTLPGPMSGSSPTMTI
jgi:hypothetical protein